MIYFRFPNKFSKEVIFEKSGSMEFVSCEDVPMITIVHNFSPLNTDIQISNETSKNTGQFKCSGKTLTNKTFFHQDITIILIPTFPTIQGKFTTSSCWLFNYCYCYYYCYSPICSLTSIYFNPSALYVPCIS